MFRTFAIAAIVALTASAVQAETLAEKVHTAAVEACAVENSASLPASHYGSINKHCVDRIAATAMVNLQAKAQARTLASTASND